jgi:TDG/mug DNA glycosylase family protein
LTLTRADLKSFHGASLPDLIGVGVKLLIVGINPGLRSAAVGAHFASRGNRFYPALLGAGIIEHPIDASSGMTVEDQDHLLARGVGITNLVERATAGADELSAVELKAGGQSLLDRVELYAPRVVAVLGVTAYRTAFAEPRAQLGRQAVDLGGTPLWVLPNPSGRNAHASLAGLVGAYREAAVAAGIVPTKAARSGRSGRTPG